MCLSLFQEQRSLKAGDLSHQESNNMAASTMKLQSDSFTSEKVSEYIYFLMKILVWRTWKTTLVDQSSISTQRSYTVLRKNARRNFPGLRSRFWRSTKERALKCPHTDSLNRKSPFLTTLKNRDRWLRRILAREVASLFNAVSASTIQRAVI